MLLEDRKRKENSQLDLATCINKVREYVIKRHLALFKLSLLKLKIFKETISATFLMYQAQYILTSLLKGRGGEQGVRCPSELSILTPWRGSLPWQQCGGTQNVHRGAAQPKRGEKLTCSTLLSFIQVLTVSFANQLQAKFL